MIIKEDKLFKDWLGKIQSAETFWELQCWESQDRKDPKSVQLWATRYLEAMAFLEEQENSILVVGGSGGLGSNLKSELPNATYLSSTDLNTTLRSNIKDILKEGKYRVIINMAAINEDSLIRKVEDDSLEKILEVNCRGSVNLLSEALSYWHSNKIANARFIHISSILSSRPIAGTGLYSASKAFVDNMIRTAALEASRSELGTTVNSIQLGYFQGGLTEKVPQKILQEVKEKIPCKRLGNSTDLKNCIQFLIDSPYITGSHIELSGGLQLV